MPPPELGLNVDNLRRMGAKAAAVSIGFGDTLKGVIAPHESAARRIGVEMPVFVHNLHHHDRSYDGQRYPDYVRALAEFSEEHGPIVVFASSAAGPYTAAAILEVPDYFAGFTSIGSRYNSSSPLDGVRSVSPEYAKMVLYVRDNWPLVELDLAPNILVTRTEGDTTVPQGASYLPFVRNIGFSQNGEPLQVNHHDGIKHILTDGLQELVDMF